MAVWASIRFSPLWIRLTSISAFLLLVLWSLSIVTPPAFIDGLSQNGDKSSTKPAPVVEPPLESEDKSDAIPKTDDPPPDYTKEEEAHTTMSKCAVIIESRPIPNLIPVILHFGAVLGPSWPIFIFVSDPASLSSGPLARDGAFDDSDTLAHYNVRRLPADAQFSSHTDVSRFLTHRWIWEQLAPASHVLLFQSDSILCANSERTADEFLQWDFVGAPIASNFGRGYNGGLSIRNRNFMLRALDANAERLAEGWAPTFEDQWYYDEFIKLGDGTYGERLDVKLPNVTEASKFSVETIWAERPLGYHQPGRFLADKLEEMTEWCPEINMLVKPRLV